MSRSRVLITLLIVGGLFAGSRLVKLRSISCESQYGRCSNDIFELVTPAVDSSMIDARKQITRILTNTETIETFSVRISSPTSYRIDVIEKSATFAVENKEYGTFAIIDETGVVMELVEHSVLPSVVTEDTLPNIGERVSDETLFGVNLARRLRPQYEMATFYFKGRHLEVQEIDDFTVLFPVQGDVDVLLGSLTLILSRLKQSQEEFRIENNQTIRQIDLRFKNPVLR